MNVFFFNATSGCACTGEVTIIVTTSLHCIHVTCNMCGSLPLPWRVHTQLQHGAVLPQMPVWTGRTGPISRNCFLYVVFIKQSQFSLRWVFILRSENQSLARTTCAPLFLQTAWAILGACRSPVGDVCCWVNFPALAARGLQPQMAAAAAMAGAMAGATRISGG